ncbi:hypothetical protein BSKO_01382 [Bryopsis sp. KO-2023]|nr:hypothetical protein BSKO_01382 [Bryopsis sp. KO-2023]
MASQSQANEGSDFGPELADWISSNGGSVGNVEVVKELFGGWGLKATQECKKGTVLIDVPKKCQVTYDKSADPKLLALIEQVPEELWGGRLALKLIGERAKGDESFFVPYLKSLPVGVPGLPMFYQGPILRELQYPPLIEQVKKRCRWLVDFGTKQLAPLKGTEQDPFGGVSVSVDGLGWGLGVVSSRAFRTRGPKEPAAMLPLIDMCNHSFEPNCEIVGSKEGTAMVAKIDIKAGESFFLNYGNLPNDFLLLDYGFVVPVNPYDTVQLRFDLNMIELGRDIGGLAKAKVGKGVGKDGSIELHEWQKLALVALGLAGPNADLQVNIGGKSTVDPRFLAALRILFVDDRAKIRNVEMDSLGSWDTPIDPQNEVKALRTLAGILASTSAQFPTKLEDDQVLMSGGEFGDPNTPLVLSFRIEKKVVLMQAIQFVGLKLKEIAEAGKASKSSQENKKGFG